MAEEDVSLRLDLKNRRETAAGINEIGDELNRTGDQAARAGRQADGASRGFSRMGRAGKMAGGMAKAGFAGLLVAGAAATAVLKGGFAEAQEARKVGAQTNAVLKSTGGVANVSAKHVDKLSTAISNKIGVDDEAIAAGQNMLLTFSQVRNEAGKGNKIFDRATRTASDMAAAFGGDATSNSKMLGKALNNPAKGVTALTRVGVTFTAQQVKQIKKTQANNDMLGAQKIMLAELEKQTKGSAKAQATAADHMGVSWGNLQEKIGMKVAPALDKVFTWVTKDGIPAVEALGPTIGKAGRWLGEAGDRGMELWNSLRSGGGQMKDLRETAVETFEGVKSIVSDTVTIATVLWRKFGDDIVSYASSTLTNALQVFRGVKDVVVGTFKLIKAIVTGDWKGMWAAVKQIVSGAWNVVVGLVKQGVNLIRMQLSVGGKILGATWRLIWDGLKKAASAVWPVIQTGVAIGAAKVVSVVKAIPGKITSAAKAGFKTAGKALIDAFIAGLKGAGNLVSDISGNIWTAIKTLLNNGIDKLNGALEFSVNVLGKEVGINPDNIDHLAKGGPAAAGRPYVVGEKRPELFVPDQDGTVVPRVPSLNFPRLGETGGWERAWDDDTELRTSTGEGGVMVIQLVLPDGKVLAEMVLDEMETKGARGR